MRGDQNHGAADSTPVLLSESSLAQTTFVPSRKAESQLPLGGTSLLHPGRPSLKHARQPFLAECGPSYATALNYLDWNREAHRLRGLEVEYHLEFNRELNRQTPKSTTTLPIAGMSTAIR
jgi:hypothetical protein